VDIVQEYAKAGFRLFPLRDGGKEPEYGLKWKETPYDPNLARADFLGNYGVIADGFLILDVDVKKGAPGKESLKKLAEKAALGKGWFDDTFIVRTGTGGFHIYFRVPEGVDIGVNHPDYPGLEFRYGPFYVVGPGSVHPETKAVYEVLSGGPLEIMDAPAALIELVKRKPKPIFEGPEPEEGFVDDDPANVDRYKDVLAQMPEIPKGQGQSNSIYIAACRGRDLGLSQGKTREVIDAYYNQIKLVPPVDGAELDHVVRSAYTYGKEKPGRLNVAAIFKTAEVGEKMDTGTTRWDFKPKSNIPQKTLNNCVNYLVTLPQLNDVFRFNCFSSMVEVAGQAPWYKERGPQGPNLTDSDITLLKFFLTKTIRVEFATQTIQEAIMVAAHKRHYHPIRNYLNSLEWDGTPRLDSWLSKYGGAVDTVYTREVGRKVLCAAVKRVFEPGCKWDHVLIIEGSQGIGKSTACRILGRSWAGDMNLDPHSKDAVAMMLNKWIIELSELSALNWGDTNALKSFITRDKDTVRLAYERHARDFARQSIFIATVNPEHIGYLKDVTGNRRYWIVRFSGMVDLVGLENAADQLWAEARAIYDKERLYLIGEAAELQALEAQMRMPEEPMRYHVNRWIKENPSVDEIRPEVILEYCGFPMKSVTRGDQSRIAQALTELGWMKNIVRDGAVFVTTYLKPERERLAQLMESI